MKKRHFQAVCQTWFTRTTLCFSHLALDHLSFCDREGSLLLCRALLVSVVAPNTQPMQLQKDMHGPSPSTQVHPGSLSFLGCSYCLKWIRRVWKKNSQLTPSTACQRTQITRQTADTWVQALALPSCQIEVKSLHMITFLVFPRASGFIGSWRQVLSPELF